MSMNHMAASVTGSSKTHALDGPASFWTMCKKNGLLEKGSFEGADDRCAECEQAIENRRAEAAQPPLSAPSEVEMPERESAHGGE